MGNLQFFEVFYKTVALIYIRKYVVMSLIQPAGMISYTCGSCRGAVLDFATRRDAESSSSADLVGPHLASAWHSHTQTVVMVKHDLGPCKVRICSVAKHTQKRLCRVKFTAKNSC